jgi:multiple sugar transport system permease protein
MTTTSLTTAAASNPAVQPSGRAAPDPHRATPRGLRRRIRNVALPVLLTGVVLLVLIPFVWMISSSLKQDNQVFTIPTQWVPREFVWSNFADIWTRIPMLTYLRNSAFLAVTISFLQVLTGSFAAYGFAKLRFPGRDALFLAYLATIAVPWQAYMIPQYLIMEKLGLVNTHLSIILLQAFGAFGVFLMRQYYATIPDELIEAARIDGLGEYRIWARIMLPLSRPAIASLGLLTFIATWNDYMGPFIYLTSNELWTVQLGLRSFVGQFDSSYAMIMTGSVISVVPVVLVFLIGQRQFIQGIATSGLKG